MGSTAGGSGHPAKSGSMKALGISGIGLATAAVALLLLVSPAAATGTVVLPTGVLASGSGCHAAINQVSGLSDRNLTHRIVIIGTCFGRHPDYVNVSTFNSYTGMDTKNCGNGTSPPTLAISEWASSGTGDWSAGRFVATNGACPWGDAIGLFYSSWSPTKIVIMGFGNALGTATQNAGAPYQMAPHAECSVYIHNPANEVTAANYTMPRGTC
jgi:hypothetical protein